jgi:hypothetical protein
MSEQTPPQKVSVVGEDGELLKPDTTIDPDAYEEFVATYVRRDPLLFRMREHVKNWGYAYAFFVPITFCGIVTFFSMFAHLTVNTEDILLFIGLLVLAIGSIYWTLHQDTRP